MDVSRARWRKSSYSAHDGGECVEIAGGNPNVVLVRDSKNPEGPVLAFAADDWRHFILAIKGGRR